MGFFSWLLADTGEPIRNRHTDDGPTPCKMIYNNRSVWVELNYDGYGIIGGQDYYELVDIMNGGTGDRDRGINLAFDDDQSLRPKLVSLNCTKSWDELPNNETDPNQGYW